MSCRLASRSPLFGAAFVVAVVGTGCGSIEAPSPDIPMPAPTTLAPSRGSTVGGQLIAIQGTGFSEDSAILFDGVPATDVKVVSAGVITAVTPPHAEGAVTVRVFDRLGRSAELVDAYTYERSFNQEGRPRLVNAVSTSNTGVRVIFSEPVSDGAEEILNYSITHAHVNPESGDLIVHSATLSDDGIYVDLVTSSQNELIYELAAANIRDLDGNLLAPPELLVNPSVVDFAGTPPVATGTLVDSDGDGLYDHVEVSGWTVTVWLSNDDIVQSTHTSDPFVADTDGDGLEDADELLAGTNPRVADTDGDMVSDTEEWNDWWSDPTKQDTDDDGFADSVDLLFGTSPILDDTDGDGYEDYQELFELNRDPLLADLPRPQIVITAYDLTLNVTSSYTDETGTVHQVESASTVSVSQAQATSLSRSDTRSVETANQSSQAFGGEFGYSTKDGFSGKVTANVGFEQSRSQGYSSTVDTETARQSQRSVDESVGEALATSENRSITRSIDSARIVATVNVANASDVPFTLENLEITVMRQDRQQGGGFRPVATLRPSGGADLSLNLGPFDSERGPIIFENTDIFPNLVEELMREPTGLVFKVANFDVTDEEGRNFAYSSATVNSRTAGITIDYGDGRTRTYRVATHNRFDADGRAPGITMERALELMGFDLVQNDVEIPDVLPSPIPAAIRNSVGTLVDATGVERLVRVGGVQNDFDDTDAEKRFWTIQTNNDVLDADVDFSSITLRAGQEYLFLYARDVDEDQLFDREEAMYGSSDDEDDTDGDTLGDYDEVRTGWLVSPTPGVPYMAFPSPARPDSDLDGLSDLEEQEYGTDPNRADTDSDGLTDAIEIRGEITVYLFDGDADDSNNAVLNLVPYEDDFDSGSGTWVRAVAPGPDEVCQTTAEDDDVQVTTVGTTVDGDVVCVSAGPNGVIDSDLGGDDFERARHKGLFNLDPTLQDTDFDGLPDGREVVIGTNPNARDAGSVTDTDGDGLYDAEEANGWDVYVDGVFVTHVTSNPSAPDTDLDGLPDVYEFAIFSHPRARDTDGDLLEDDEEFDPADTDGYYEPIRLSGAEDRCALASSCTPPALLPIADRLRTDPRATDTDGDTRGDFVEVTVPWTVTVTGAGGQTATQVYSRPYAADADVDGLDDAEELAEGTDPGDSDTDDDGTLDAAELAVTIGSNHRNPTIQDRRVTIRLPNSILVAQSCDGLEDVTVDNPDFSGSLSVTYPSTSTETVYNFDNCDGRLDAQNCLNTPVQRTFFLQVGQSFSYESTSVVEFDITDSENLGNIATQSFDYTTIASQSTISNQHDMSHAGREAWCSITVFVSIEIQ